MIAVLSCSPYDILCSLEFLSLVAWSKNLSISKTHMALSIVNLVSLSD